MVKTLLNLTTILSLFIIPLILHSQIAFSTNDYIEGEEDYVLDNQFPSHFRTRSRFLKNVIKEGAQCNANKITKNVCNGVSANKGTTLFNCCKTHCRNVLGDMNNCGKCGQKCGLGQRCCGGICTKILNNSNNCGKCNKKCSAGVRCVNGFCGYA
ncbi:Stigma-specific protein Stig1 [Quillaja saponaria]|uniref:Stigma-specific protein Stig1 n=1 Tax=Quillaja saponaria TaxID=32244 RepID=A0AAD7QHT6_QUISA|nr:Stigma-specific protein Stig1 [Quillaja saponaria]